MKSEFLTQVKFYYRNVLDEDMV